MNIPSTQKNSIKKVSPVHQIGCAAAVALALSACSPSEKEKVAQTPDTSPAISSETVQDNFCHDVSSAHFDPDVRKKIYALQNEIPQLASLLANLESVPNSAIHFFDRDGFISFLQKKGNTIIQAEKYIKGVGAMTYIPRKRTQTEKAEFCIYLSPYALKNKNHFIEGVVNELLNALMAVQLPNKLEKKQRAPDKHGGINISNKDMQGIGIEFTKEYMSGLMSTLIREQYQKKDIRCSIGQLRDNLRKGIFWHTDSPNYALEYFYDILKNHGFPVERNDELVKLYTFCIDSQWVDISRNVVRMGKGLHLPITE